MKTHFVKSAFLLVLTMLAISVVSAQRSDTKPKSKVQVALLLDTSNSMDGLIDQAKTELWSIVNELATAKYDGQRPELEIALYEYGNDNLESADGFVRMVSPFTTDLDAISELLFALKTNGGYEYCGQVIGEAVKELEWSKSNHDLKMIVIAGNEEFTQGEIDYKVTCKEAASKGAIINTIFCGDHDEGIRIFWKDGADRADGKYMNIDQNQEIAYIETPYDDDILNLNNQLNKTYIGYGQAGEEYAVRQEAQDMNAASMNKKASVGRSVSKSSGAYKNAHWDLVDAVDEEAVELDELNAEDLPEVMQDMDKAERKAYVAEKKKERSDIQKQIQTLNGKREAYITKHRKEMAEDATLGSALIKIVRDQALAKGFTFEKM